jgi:hypothetical protein
MDPTSGTATARLKRWSCLKVADKRSWHRVWGVIGSMQRAGRVSECVPTIVAASHGEDATLKIWWFANMLCHSCWLQQQIQSGSVAALSCF